MFDGQVINNKVLISFLDNAGIISNIIDWLMFTLILYSFNNLIAYIF